MTINEFAYKAHENAKEKGFWKERLSNEHFLMLVITEIAEAVEADRKYKCAKKEEYEDLPNKQIGYEMYLKGSLEDEMADIAIRLADIAGALGIDFTKMNTCNYYRAFDRFTFTENAFDFTKVLSRQNIVIEKRILFGLDYVFNWAKSMGFDLWFFIEHKMRYNALRPTLHGKRY